MAWRPHPKGTTVDPENPRCWGTDDRTGFVTNLGDLSWQMEWGGNTLYNKKLLVRSRSLDTPSPFLRSILLPPDPPPIMNARPEPYAIDEAGVLFSADNSLVMTASGDFITIM